jgi:putative nucleotidyltransferase with HDIG domain
MINGIAGNGLIIIHQQFNLNLHGPARNFNLSKQWRLLFMGLSEEKKVTDKNIPGPIMTEVSSFPSMPRAAIKLRELLAEEAPSADEIESVLRSDPGLATNVLRLANSAFFGVPRKVETLKHAVTLLGVKRFAQIAVSASMNKTMDKAVEGYDLSPGELWLHSIAVSNTAEALGRQKKLAKTDDVFTPALLHDMGKLVLSQFVKEERQNIERIMSTGSPLDEAENMVLGTDHAEIGALILAKWSFPDNIVNAVRWHHHPERNNNATTKSDMTYLSNLMCQPNSGGESGVGQSAEPSVAVLERLVIKSDQYEAIASKTQSWIRKLSSTLTFD